MRPLAELERFLERLLERPAARLFRTRLQPIQVQRRVERAMEANRRTRAGRVRVPDRYAVRLALPDVADLGIALDDVAAQLADAAFSFARARHYSLAGRPRVDLIADPARRAGDIEIEATFGPNAQEEPKTASQTMLFAVPPMTAPSAILHQIRPHGTARDVVLDGSLLTIGRADDNSVVLHDQRVSRHHARLRGRAGMLVLTDLGSRNGVRVNGATVTEAALGVGDQIEIGDAAFVVESNPSRTGAGNGTVVD